MPTEIRTLCEADLAGLYGQLRAMAHRHMRRERRGHSLQATDLVHEAYLRVMRRVAEQALTREEFLIAVAGAMRTVLLDHARRRAALKRGGGAANRVPLDDVLATCETRAADLLTLDEALERLAALDAELARIVELRYFAGFSEQDTAEVLKVSTRTVRRAWRIARMWLHSELERGEQHEA
jgi:RNA polymerase sigma-70 factor (ECF subfamily)